MTARPASKPTELPAAKLKWKCELSRIPFETTAQAELREGFIGQERALRALKMGAELSAPGYNVFVCGLAGTSRGGTIAHMVEELHPPTKESLDRCYVNNFKLTDRPRLLALPRGQANGFKKDMQAGIDFLRRRIPQVFEGEPFQRQKGRIVERFTVREKELMDDFTRRIARDQFALGHMQVGAVALPEIFPVLEGQMVPIEDISKMVHEGKLEGTVAEEIERKYEQFRQEFTVVYRKTLTLSRELVAQFACQFPRERERLAVDHREFLPELLVLSFNFFRNGPFELSFVHHLRYVLDRNHLAFEHREDFRQRHRPDLHVAQRKLITRDAPREIVHQFFFADSKALDDSSLLPLEWFALKHLRNSPPQEIDSRLHVFLEGIGLPARKR